PPGTHWTPVDETLAALRAAAEPVTPVRHRPLAEAAGLRLALPAIAERDNPPADNAAVDGYAFAQADIAGLPTEGGRVRLPLTPGRAAADRRASRVLAPGTAMRILTGASVPHGADTVVLQEDALAEGGAVTFTPPTKPGANVRRRGEDAAVGSVLLSPGHRLKPQDLARLAVAGVAEVGVHAPLRVGILSTGDELLQPGEDPAAIGIFDANRPMLASLAAAWGFDAVDLGAVPDRAEAVRAALDRGAGSADVILTTGGASSGDEDHVSRLLGEEGSRAIWRIAVKPGRPLALGRWQGVPIFGLPGNPVAAFVCALVFARPALEVMAGGTWPDPVGYPLPAGFAMRKKGGRREYLRARLADGRVERFHSEGSGLVGGLSWADGLVELPDEAMSLAEGDPVRFLPWASFGLA
ncbi:MAG: gephyrin-like molybdotransferase Glp, partial [Pseudomonadota bacterium]